MMAMSEGSHGSFAGDSRELARIHQARVARIAVSGSAARNQGAAGIVEAARSFLGDLDCRRLARRQAADFQRVHEEVTRELMAALPKGGRSWGLSRKLLNIFLRDVLYSHYLRDVSGLALAEAYMEVPLDSISAGRISDAFPRQLPAWKGVKALKKPVSDAFQARAAEIAAARGLARIHLDALWWGVREP